MNFSLNEEHLAVQEAARDFAQRVLKPGVIERDTQMAYPHDEVRQMGELGFMGMTVSPEYGGGGLDYLSYVLALEEISKVDNSASVIMSVNNSLVCYGIEAYGTEAQKLKYLPKLASGEWIGSFCLSEPEAPVVFAQPKSAQWFNPNKLLLDPVNLSWARTPVPRKRRRSSVKTRMAIYCIAGKIRR